MTTLIESKASRQIYSNGELIDNMGINATFDGNILDMEGYKTLKTNDIVTFDITQGEKGPQASKVKVIAEGAPETKVAEDKVEEVDDISE